MNGAAVPSPAPTAGAEVRAPWGRRAELAVLLGFWALFVPLMATPRYLAGDATSWGHALRNAVLDVGMWAAMSLAGLALARRVPLTGPRWPRALAVNLAASLLIVLARVAGDYAYIAWNGHLKPGETYAHYLAFRGPGVLLYYLTIAGTMHALVAFRELREREVRSLLLSGQLARAHLDALKAQLQPHFLFNTLNAISTLIRHDPPAAERMVENLGEMLRISLAHRREQEVALEEELRFVGAYVEIEQARFRDRLRVEIDVPPRAAAMLVPHLLLQPLVENAIRHGVAPRRAGGRVAVRARVAGESLRLEVEDDGVGIGQAAEGAAHGGVGIANARDRLRQLYGERHHFSVAPRTGGGTLAVVEIPARPAAPAPVGAP